MQACVHACMHTYVHKYISYTCNMMHAMINSSFFQPTTKEALHANTSDDNQQLLVTACADAKRWSRVAQNMLTPCYCGFSFRQPTLATEVFILFLKFRKDAGKQRLFGA